MENTRHTSGPLKVRQLPGARLYSVFSRDEQVASFENRADADLFAAAGEMSALLNEWLETPFFKSRADWREWVESFRPRVLATIAEVYKTRGE